LHIRSKIATARSVIWGVAICLAIGTLLVTIGASL
jgi:hypothetical protein